MNKSGRKTKQTYTLSKNLVDDLKSFVKGGYASSQSKLVEEALKSYMKKLMDAKIAHEFDKASKDTLFLKDIEEVNYDFHFSDQEEDI
ncbi:MAG: hypothetical protein U9N06_00630 [candidate division WOR-3 bacterium]|nr:hypothetical protein [candidate division WOR-3 bacterium]